MLIRAQNGAMLQSNTAPFCPELPLSRQRKSEPYVQQKVNLNATVMARFTRIHWDPTLQKVRYAAVSQVVNKLLADYVNKIESGAETPQVILSDSEQKMEKAL